jgi:glycosyltransferase involved in cell wall biosynthesis
MRVLRTYMRLLHKYRTVDNYDVMVLGYPGQLDVPLARVLTWLSRKPLVLDVFMSIYLIAEERGLVTRSPFTARFIYALEKLACRLPDVLILDTPAYVEWFCQTYHLAASRFRLVPTGADDRIFRPVAKDAPLDKSFKVVYYGTFIPLHGVDYIIQAALLLQDEPGIRFELIGQGPTKAQAIALAHRYGLANVTFVDWVDRHELPHRLADADVCLGVFGTTEQSRRTIQNKIYEGLALGKPVITGDSPTVRQALRHGEHVFLCERGNSQALAEAILALRHDAALRERLAREGHYWFRQRFTPTALGRIYCQHLEESLNANKNINYYT